jgi:hypothetical protein
MTPINANYRGSIVAPRARHSLSHNLRPAIENSRPTAVHPRPNQHLTFAILVPDREILHLYCRPETGRIRYCTPLVPDQLLNCLSAIPHPSVVALAGNDTGEHLSQELLQHHDLFVVPDLWLSHIPARHLDRRARTTARLVHAHLVEPIQTLLAPGPDDLPF